MQMLEGRTLSSFSFSLTSYLKLNEEGRQRYTTAAKTTGLKSFLAGASVLWFSCSLPLHSCLIPSWLQFPPERPSCRWCLSSNNRCHSRAKGNLLVMCGSCITRVPRGSGPRRSPGLGSRKTRCSDLTAGTADVRWSSEMQRSVRRQRQLLVFRLWQYSKFCISTKQRMLQMMLRLRVCQKTGFG